MLEKEFHISRLIAGHFKGELSPDEELQLNIWLDASINNRDYFNWVQEEQTIAAELSNYEHIKTTKDEVWKITRSKLGASSVKLNHSPQPGISYLRYLSFRWAAVAAVIFLLIGTITYFVIDRNLTTGPVSYVINDVPAGSNKAFITLANGKTITLSGAKSGIIVNAARLQYNDGTAIPVEQSEISTITTPRGGQYQVVLSDGTRVYLNAASSLQYPASFNGTNRIVTLIGEAYFEVAKDKKHPFIVVSKGQQVEVLGTHFNINSYSDEPSITTTLLEGKVKVASLNHKDFVLSPGQQASLSDIGTIRVDNVDTEDAVAWKNGDFVFNGDDLQTVMRQLARWYDVEVVYQGNLSNIGFVSTISRSKTLSGVLKALETTQGVHFKIEGRRILVMP